MATTDGLNGSDYESNVTDKSTTFATFKYPPSVKAWFYATLVISWATTVLIISLNIAVIRCIKAYKKRSRLYFLLFHMAIADLCTGVIDTLVHSLERTIAVVEFGHYAMAWFDDDYSCKIQRTLATTTSMASNFILAAASLDRALVVARPMMNLKRGFALQKLLIVVCWISSFLLSSPILRSFRAIYIPQMEMYACENDNTVISYWTIVHLQFAVQVLLPLAVIIISYIVLLRAIYMRASEGTNKSNNDGTGKGIMGHVFNRGLPKTKARSVRLMCGIVSAFILAWVPFFVINYLAMNGILRSPSIMTLALTYFMNGIANPVLFFIYHRRKKAESRSTTYSSELQSTTSSTIQTNHLVNK